MKLSYSQKDQFFHELAEGTRSGRSLPELLKRKADGRFGSGARVAKEMTARSGGESAGAFFTAVPEVFGELDCEVVAAGSDSGRLAEALTYLAGYYESLARTRQKIFSGLIYPVVMLHVAAVLLSVPDAVSGGGEAFLRSAGIILGVFYVVGALLVGAVGLLGRLGRGSVMFDQVLLRVPVIGPLRGAVAGARFCRVFAMLVRAGGGRMVRAVQRAAAASGSISFRAGAEIVAREIEAGEPLGVGFARAKYFPPIIVGGVETGEMGGRIDDEMDRAAVRFDDLMNRRLDALAVWLPKLVYFGIVIFVGWRIVQFWLGYYASIGKLLEGI